MDIIRDTECITSQSTQPREPQKVEKEGKPIPSELAEILGLKREAEVIDSLIADKEKTIKENQAKWYYKCDKILNNLVGDIFSISLIVIIGSILELIFPQLFANDLPISLLSSRIILVGGIDVLYSVTVCIADKFSEKIKRSNAKLSEEVNYLKTIKHQNLSEIARLQQGRPTKLEKDLNHTKNSYKLEVYQAALRIFKDGSIELSSESLEDIVQLVEQIGEKGKQKTIGTM